MDRLQVAMKLIEAERSRVPISHLSEEYPGISDAAAYGIQLALVEQKLKMGGKVAGKKVGLASKAAQEQFQAHEPDFGHLLDHMVLPNGGFVEHDSLIQPKVEGELAFILKKELWGPGISRRDVYEATAFIAGAIEVIDSRYHGWRLCLADTIADNGSSAYAVMGEIRRPIEELDLVHLGATMQLNGDIIGKGVGASVLGDPVETVVWLANKLAEFNLALKEGEIILSGSLSSAVEVKKGDCFKVVFEGLGPVEVAFY